MNEDTLEAKVAKAILEVETGGLAKWSDLVEGQK